MKTKLLLVLLSITTFGFTQTLKHSYNFSNGSLADEVGGTNYDLSSNNGQQTQIPNNRLDANEAIKLNSANILTSANPITLTQTSSVLNGYTISFWLRPEANNKRHIIRHYNTVGWKFEFFGDKLKFIANQQLASSNVNDIKTITFPNDLEYNKWYHIALTAKKRVVSNGGTNKEYKVDYNLTVNAKKKHSVTSTLNDYRVTQQNIIPNSILAIGDAGNDGYRNGIDDIKYYDDVLTDEAIEALFKEGAARIYVNHNQTTNTQDGLTWATAFNNLQAALTYSQQNASAQEIWVAKGTYVPGVNRDDSFKILRNIDLYGGFNGTETSLSERNWVTNQTILSGDINANDDNTIKGVVNTTKNDNAYNVLFLAGSAFHVGIDGFSISNGFANTNHNLYPNQSRGAAIYKIEDLNKISIKNCIIEHNTSLREGNVSLPHNSLGTSYVTIENCIVRNNWAIYGAGIKVQSNDKEAIVDFKLYNSLFYGNVVEDIDATNKGFSGSSLMVFTNDGTLNANLVNNTFTKNYDSGTTDVASNDKGTILLRRLNDNSNNTLNVSLYNSIFYNNYSDNSGTVNTNDIGLMNKVSNKINSLNYSYNRSTANLTSLASKVEPTGYTQSNNVTIAPDFVDESNNDFHLTASSGLLNVGNNSKVPSSLLVDLDNTIRIQNNTVDLGVYEYGTATLSNEKTVTKSTKITLYPNPVKNTLYINTNNTIKSIEVYNILGDKLFSGQEKSVDVSNYSKGIYLLKIYNEAGKAKTKKFIIK